MSPDLLLGIDLGTSTLKAAAFDAAGGRCLAFEEVRLPVRTAADGTREQDLGAVDRALARATTAIRRRLGRASARLAGVGVSAQGGSAIIADRATGEALAPMMLWNDTRPLHLLAGIAARQPRGYWQRLSYLAEPGAGLARIAWLRARRPRLFRGGRMYVGAGEYVYFRLTGVWRQDAGNALQIGCYDARRRCLAEAPLRLVGADTSLVAPMRQGHETHPLGRGGAAMLGLAEGIPVAGPYLDHEAGYLSAVGLSARPLQCSLGTAWVGNFVLEPGRSPPPGFNLVLPSPVGPGSLVVRVMLAGNVTWDWALRTLVDGGAKNAAAQADAILREDVFPPPGLVGLPWLARPNVLAPEQPGSGGFLGVSAHTTRADLLRALVAGMAFELARVFEGVKQSGAVDSVVLGGGAMRGGHFPRLLASLFAPLPVYGLEDEAMAGVRGALYAFSPRVAQARGRRQIALRGAEQARCQRGFDLYCRACEALARGLPRGGGELFATANLRLAGYRRRGNR
jgi:sugar (pentulose or hexulose) kinase